MADRVRRPHEFEAMMLDLTKEMKVFESYKDLMIFAACLGFRRKKRMSFEKSSEPINLSIFSGDFDGSVMNALAVAEIEDPLVMGNESEDKKILIFEEYACGGLDILKTEYWDVKIDNWENALIHLVLQEENENKMIDDITNL
jgi:dnd system-associated protein 4